MLNVLAPQNHWVTRQVDFSNAFVQAPLTKDVFVTLPPMFGSVEGKDPRTVCLKLNKLLCGMKEAPKLWSDFLEKGLKKSGFTLSCEDSGLCFG